MKKLVLGTLVLSSLCSTVYANNEPKLVNENSSVKVLGEGVIGNTAGTIDVLGVASVEALPDIVTLSYTVTSSDANTGVALKNAQDITSKFITSLQESGIKTNQISSGNITVRPEFIFNKENRKRELTSYLASKEVKVTLTDFKKIVDVNEKATKAGIKQVNGYNYDIQNRSVLEKQAKQLAIKDAQEQAKILSDGFNVKITHPISMTFNANTPMPFAPEYMMTDGMNGPNMMKNKSNSYLPEKTVIKAQVAVKYATLSE